MTEARVPSKSNATLPEPNPEDDNPDDRYWMSKRAAVNRNLTEWLFENETDHALKVRLVLFDCAMQV